MLIIHGTKHLDLTKVGVRTDYCNACERDTVTELWRSFAMLHIFWIPLIPVGERQRWLCCKCHGEARARYRTGRPMKILGMMASLIFLAAMLISKPDQNITAGFLWGARIFFSLAFAGLLYLTVKPLPPYSPDQRRAAARPLSVKRCLYCNGALQSEPYLFCPVCRIRVYTDTGARNYSIDAIMALPPDEAMDKLHKALNQCHPRSQPEFNLTIAEASDYTIADDGLLNWFTMATPEELRDTHDAYVALGANRRAEMLRTAFKIFPNGTPPDNPTVFQACLEHLTINEKKQLDELGDIMSGHEFQNAESLSALGHQFVLKHLADFRDAA